LPENLLESELSGRFNAWKPSERFYRSYGFKLTETIEHCIWGQNVVEERWDVENEKPGLDDSWNVTDYCV